MYACIENTCAVICGVIIKTLLATFSGETIARDITFLLLTTLVQNFDIIADPKSAEPDLEPAVSFLVTAKPYKAVFLERNK